MILPVRERIGVLILDNNDMSRNLVHQSIQTFEAPEFDFEIFLAESRDDYWRVVADHTIDVLLLELRLDSTSNDWVMHCGEGSDSIISHQLLHSPATIVIPFTSVDSIDPVETTVRVMRSGALDFFNRDRPGFENLIVTSVVSELRRRRSGESAPSSAWIESRLPELVEEYAGQAVAISGQTVVLAAPTVHALRKKLAVAALPYTPVLLVVPNRDEPK